MGQNGPAFLAQNIMINTNIENIACHQLYDLGAMLEKTGVSLGQVDQVEINEAFAAQALSCQKALEIPMEKFNTCGGAIALGHPLAASGSRISAHVVHKLRQNGQKYGIGSACIGGGQGISILFEKV